MIASTSEPLSLGYSTTDSPVCAASSSAPTASETSATRRSLADAPGAAVSTTAGLPGVGDAPAGSDTRHQPGSSAIAP